MRSSLALVALLFLTGCEAKSFLDQASKEWDAIVTVLQGGRNPLQAKASPTPAATPTEEIPDLARLSKEHSELLSEMVQVIFLRLPEDRSMFGSYVDSLNQGASLEGVYNGFTHSSQYRSLEEAHRGASPEALKIFGEELALLQAELPVTTEFDEKSARPLATPEMPTGVSGGVEPAISPFPSFVPGTSDPVAVRAEPSKCPVDVPALSRKYSRIFIGASIFTLKRVLGDEALKVIERKKAFREQLALWYTQWVVRLCGRGVDFGLVRRNQPDEDFHYKWAFGSSVDRVQWEVLNRIHRLLNEANRNKP